MSEFLHSVDTASPFGKSTMDPHDLRYPTLSVSLAVSGSVSLAVEVATIGPESHVSHTEGGAAFVSKMFFYFFFSSHVIPVSQHRICSLFPWFIFPFGEMFSPAL